MDRFSFGTFLVDEYNQEAFSLCHDVANLRTDTSMPIVLIGDPGTGKTHLLYSIVARIRTLESSTGIAYVTANEIPDSVRGLLEHPAPVKDAANAVLLVDHLESFNADIDVLERIIRLFLDNGHSVVCATNVHPARITHFPGSFAKLLDEGHRVSILPQDSPSRLELVEYTIREEHEGIIARLEQEIDDLKQFVTSSSESHESAEDEESLLFSLRKELEITKAELDMAQAKLSGSSQDAVHDAHPEVENAPTIDVRGLMEEIEQLRGENALNAVAGKEAVALRGRIDSLQKERDALRDQLGQEGGSLEAPSLGVTLDASGEQNIREDAQMMVKRAEKMVREMQENREKFVESQQQHQQQLTEIKALEDAFRQHETISVPKKNEEVEAFAQRLATLEQERDVVVGQYDSLKERLKVLEVERERVHGEFAEQKAELQQCKEDLKEAQVLLTEKTEAMISLDMSLEHLRKDQTDTTGQFNAEISRYEQRLAKYRAETEEAKQNEAFLEKELTSIQTQLKDASERVQRIVSSGSVDDDEPEASVEDTDDDESSQISELVDHFDLDDPRR